MKHKELADIRHENHAGEEVCEWEFINIGHCSRLYFKPNEIIGLGFDFYAFERTGFSVNEHTGKDDWHKNHCNGECIFRGIAYFDGIRHLHYGDENTDNDGYHYYANLENIIDTMKELRMLEKKYCRDLD